MKKTILVICLVLALFGQGLFAAGAQEPAKAEAKTTLTKTDPNEKVTLRFAWWGSTPRHQATLKAIELYQSKHPNVTIEAEYGAFKDYYQKLLTQLSGKTAPDIISVDYKWVSDLRSQGEHLLNMYDLKDYIDMSGIDMSFAKIYGGDDKYLIGLPMGVNGMGYLYNKRFLEKYGVTPGNDWTWDTIVENGKKVHSQDPTKYLLCNTADHWNFMFKSILKQYAGKTVLNDDYSVAITKDEALYIFNYVKTLVDNGVVPPFSEAVLYEKVYADQNPNWLNENFGIFPTSSSLIPGIQAASNFECGSLRYPVMANPKDPGLLVTPSMFVGVYKESKYQDIAADFINFIINDPEAIEILKDTRGIPANSKALDQLTKANVIPQVVSDMVNQSLTGAGMAENGPSLNPEVVALIKDFIQQVGYGKLTPEAAADGFIKELTSLAKSLN